MKQTRIFEFILNDEGAFATKTRRGGDTRSFNLDKGFSDAGWKPIFWMDRSTEHHMIFRVVMERDKPEGEEVIPFENLWLEPTQHRV